RGCRRRDGDPAVRQAAGDLVPASSPGFRAHPGRDPPAGGDRPGHRGGLGSRESSSGARDHRRGDGVRIGITCYPPYGGSGALATELGLDLARRGHEVHFITYAMPFRLKEYVERVYFHEVDTISGRYPLFEHYPYTLALASKQYEVAHREGLDLLHVHYAIPHATTAFLAREMLGPDRRLPVITTLHGTDITLVGQESSFYAITKFSIESSDKVTAVSQYLKDETVRTFGCANCGILVIPNFVNVAEYGP